VPKGLVEPGESPERAARREFAEETGARGELGPLVDVGVVTMRSGKRVHGFAVLGQFDCERLASNEVELEYPPRSGRLIRFPEVDRAQWAGLEQVRSLLTPALVPLVERAFAAVVGAS
jgi:predicted NUDIX family NTP pyrophosphohydrolase